MSKIKGVILGGGRGTRLLPLTAKTNKHLLNVGDKPIILYAIKQLVEAGVKDIILIIDERHANEFMALIKDGSHLNVDSVAYVWQSKEGKGLPTAISKVKSLIQNEKIIVVCGDVIIENGFKNAVEQFLEQKDGARVITTYKKDTAGYSLVENDGKIVTKIYSKDKKRHKPGLIDLGVYMYHSDVFLKIRKLKPSLRNETEIWDLNRIYVREKKLFHNTIKGWWCDTGSSIKTCSLANEHYKK